MAEILLPELNAIIASYLQKDIAGDYVRELTGIQIWYKNGKKHRDSGPAIIYADVSREFWKDGAQYDL